MGNKLNKKCVDKLELTNIKTLDIDRKATTTTQDFEEKLKLQSTNHESIGFLTMIELILGREGKRPKLIL